MSSNWQLKYSVLLILLIIIPSFFLAYFSVRSAEAERLVFNQRIRDSYERLAQFAASDIDNIMNEVGWRWLEVLQPKEFSALSPEKQAVVLTKLVNDNDLITNAYLVNNTGRVSFPVEQVRKSLPEQRNTPTVSAPEFDTWLLKFHELSDDAEEEEFKKANPAGALKIYQDITSTFPVPRLQAIALGEIARIYMFQAEWETAYQYYQKIVQDYPAERNLNNLHLRFYAQFQSVVTLENLEKYDRAMPALLDLYEDLLIHSDEVNRVQFEYFVERIQLSFKRQIGRYDRGKQSEYRAIYQTLQEQKKKNIGETYIVEKLYQRLSKRILKQETLRRRLKYFSDFAVEQPYLVAYILLSEGKEYVVESALGLELDLDKLKSQLFPQIVARQNFPKDVTIAIIDKKGKLIMGEEEKILSEPTVSFELRDPLDFWKLGIFPTYENPLLTQSNDDLYLQMLGIFLLFVIILIGAFMFIRNFRKQQDLSLQKTTFISSISHELKTPLTSIKMFVDFLSRNEKLQKEPETRKYLNIIRSESERLNQLVDNVLDFSKIERGAKNYQFEYEESGAVIRSVVDAFGYHAEVHGVKINVDLKEPLPELLMDRHAISRALINLLSNAIKYSLDKQPVTVRAAKNGEYLNIAVEDTGIGIKQKYLGRIFDDYFRIEEGDVANIAGTGLGLPLVKYIAEAHDGEVSVSSTFGEGSVFTLKLPLNKN